MKKFFCLLIALLLAGSIALSESVDLSSMTDDELISLQTVVETEISSRGLKEKPISEGIYSIGVFLPQGRYTFKAHKAEKDGDYVWIYIGVFRHEEDVWDNDKALTTYCLTEDNKTYSIDLSHGQYLHITTPGGTCTYTTD